MKFGNNVLRSTENTLVVSYLARNFEYVECVDCHQILDIGSSCQIELLQWKFDFMGLRPSALGVAKGRCASCRSMREQFRGVLSQ